MPVRAHVMMADASNHSGWDPGRDFWRCLRHREEAPPDGLSACETFRACPDCGGDVGVVEDAPSDASSDVDLPPLGGFPWWWCYSLNTELGLVSNVRTSM